MSNIDKTIKFLKNTFSNSAYFNQNLVMLQYRLEHTFRVANIGKTIALKENLNVEAVIVGCLLHDISYSEEMVSESDWKNHGRRSAQMSKNFIMSLDFDDEIKNQILYGIAIHVDDEADFLGKRTVLAETIGESDNIDRFDKYRLYESLLYSKIDEMSLRDKINFLTERICKLNNLKKIIHKSKTSNDLWNQKLDYQIEYYSGLISQFNSSGEIV